MNWKPKSILWISTALYLFLVRILTCQCPSQISELHDICKGHMLYLYITSPSYFLLIGHEYTDILLWENNKKSWEWRRTQNGEFVGKASKAHTQLQGILLGLWLLERGEVRWGIYIKIGLRTEGWGSGLYLTSDIKNCC